MIVQNGIDGRWSAYQKIGERRIVADGASRSEAVGELQHEIAIAMWESEPAPLLDTSELDESLALLEEIPGVGDDA